MNEDEATALLNARTALFEEATKRLSGVTSWAEHQKAIANVVRADITAEDRSMDEELQTAIERVHAFSQSWNDDDVVDEVGHLTGKDLRLVVEHLRVAEAAPTPGVTD